MLAAFALSACSQLPAGEARFEPSASTALNVVRMAGLEGLSDSPAPVPSSHGTTLADAGFAVSTISNPPPGIGNGGGLALGALSLLGSLPVERPVYNRHVYAWVPLDLAPSPDDAAQLAKAEFQDALVKAFDPGQALEEREGSFTPTLAPTTRHRVWVRSGCQPFKDRHRDDFDRGCSGAVRVFVKKPENLRSHQPAPPFLVRFASVRGPIELNVSIEGIFSDWWKDDGNVQAVSRHLPAWMFIYVPPRKDGVPPRVLAQGEVLEFREP